MCCFTGIVPIAKSTQTKSLESEVLWQYSANWDETESADGFSWGRNAPLTPVTNWGLMWKLSSPTWAEGVWYDNRRNYAAKNKVKFWKKGHRKLPFPEGMCVGFCTFSLSYFVCKGDSGKVNRRWGRGRNLSESGRSCFKPASAESCLDNRPSAISFFKSVIKKESETQETAKLSVSPKFKVLFNLFISSRGGKDWNTNSSHHEDGNGSLCLSDFLSHSSLSFCF